MRREPTYNEKRLWKLLRKLDLADTHFRRQVPFGSYVADFACHRSRLIVELDGGIHALPEVAARDAARDEWLKARGYTVLRITDQDLKGGMDVVFRRIMAALGAHTPSPDPSPQGGGEKMS